MSCQNTFKGEFVYYIFLKPLFICCIINHLLTLLIGMYPATPVFTTLPFNIRNSYTCSVYKKNNSNSYILLIVNDYTIILGNIHNKNSLGQLHLSSVLPGSTIW